MSTGCKWCQGRRQTPEIPLKPAKIAARIAISALALGASGFRNFPSPMKQRTLAREVSIKGSALHTGDAVTLTIKPAPVDHGVVFKRTDIHGSPEILPRIDLV